MSEAMRRDMVRAGPRFAYNNIVSWWEIVMKEYEEYEADRVVRMLTHPSHLWLSPAAWNAMTGEQQAAYIDRIGDEVQE